MTPIQPRLAESNLFLVSAGGPGALSFNEFNPIFNRNGLTFQASGLAGENSTYAGEGVLAGIYKKLSYSFGGFHYQTDGFRRNADQNDDIGNAFVQLELTPKPAFKLNIGIEIMKEAISSRDSSPRTSFLERGTKKRGIPHALARAIALRRIQSSLAHLTINMLTLNCRIKNRFFPQ